MFRPPAASGRSGPGVSADGYEGANAFFHQVKSLAGDLKIPGVPTMMQESASAKAAVDAYMSARNGVVPSNDAFFRQGSVPGDFPQVDLKPTDAASPLTDIGKAVTELMSHMGEMLNQLISSPMGVLGNLMSFLFKLFTEIAEGVGQALSEAAQAIATVVEDAWKKQMEVASGAATQGGLQPLELYTQAATTQTLAHALQTGAST